MAANPNPRAAAPVIEVQNVAHRYGDRPALDGVSFAVQPAEIFGLLGPNGSGKTTLFRILSTLMLPSSGRAIVGGHDVATDPSGVRRAIGIVHQQMSVDLRLTATENLRHSGHLYGLSGQRLSRRIDDMLKHVALADRAGEAVERFSGGMQRRVQLAAGLLHRPSVLLLDEPTTGLDPGARRDLWLYLDTLRREEDVTIVVTTHLMEEAERCDRLAILNHGKLVALGTPAELTSEIGGDVILLETANAESLAGRISSRFGAQAKVLDGSIRLECQNGARFAAEVVEAFPGEIDAVNVAKPSIEDVFIHRTGHRFWQEEKHL